ncbi:MAG: DUF3293 domain-containing protein [Pleurocapsa sp. MO_226.B13]|nr:DUF3293 domain-containing protein [Pleurocapsa sp. MO_226.B13]
MSGINRSRYCQPKFTEAEITSLQTAYQKAIYEVYYGKETIKLEIGKYNPRLGRLLEESNCTSWALITAFNPYSQPRSPTENQQRHQSLIEHLQSLPFILIDALGKDPNGDWTPETSVLIVGIKLIQAKEIGRKFAQNAIVYGELGKPPELQWL